MTRRPKALDDVIKAFGSPDFDQLARCSHSEPLGSGLGRTTEAGDFQCTADVAIERMLLKGAPILVLDEAAGLNDRGRRSSVSAATSASQ